MAKRVYIGVNDVARKVKKMYIGVHNFTPRALPSGYTQVEYIESTGTQYFDMGFKPNQNTRVVMECQALALDTGGTFPFGVRAGLNSKAFSVALTPTQVFYNFATTYEFASFATPLERMVIDANKNVATFTGTTTATISLANSAFTCDSNLLIATSSDAGTPYSGVTAWHGRIFWCKDYDNGTLIRDCVPCVNATGVAGLYDVVNGVFYTNAGTGAFTVGPICKGVARKIKKGYIGVGGVARPFWTGGELTYWGTTTKLNKARLGPASANTQSYALFAGGNAADSTSSTNFPNNVDAYNSSLTRTTTTLNQRRGSMGGASVGNYALFAGGSAGGNGRYANVEAFDNSLTRKDATALSLGRDDPCGGSIGNYALFAGGATNSSLSGVNNVEAYNASLTRSIPTTLSAVRYNIASANVGSYVVFAGGSGTNSKVVDAYNTSLTRTVPTALSSGRWWHKGAKVTNYAIFAGGASNLAVVEAYDASLTRSTLTSLSVGRYRLAAASIEGYAIFSGGDNSSGVSKVTDAYDESLTRINPAGISVARRSLAGASIGNFALFAGGYGSAYSDVVDAYTVG